MNLEYFEHDKINKPIAMVTLKKGILYLKTRQNLPVCGSISNLKLERAVYFFQTFNSRNKQFDVTNILVQKMAVVLEIVNNFWCHTCTRHSRLPTHPARAVSFFHLNLTIKS